MKAPLGSIIGGPFLGNPHKEVLSGVASAERIIVEELQWLFHPDQTSKSQLQLYR